MSSHSQTSINPLLRKSDPKSSTNDVKIAHFKIPSRSLPSPDSHQVGSSVQTRWVLTQQWRTWSTAMISKTNVEQQQQKTTSRARKLPPRSYFKESSPPDWDSDSVDPRLVQGMWCDPIVRQVVLARSPLVYRSFYWPPKCEICFLSVVLLVVIVFELTLR